MTTDLIGRPLTEVESDLLRLYTELKEFAAREDLAPAVRAGALTALAPLGVAVTDLGLALEHLTDIGA